MTKIRTNNPIIISNKWGENFFWDVIITMVNKYDKSKYDYFYNNTKQ